MNKQNISTLGAQSILEYVVCITIIGVMILVGTDLYQKGISRGLNNALGDINRYYVSNTDVPDYVKSQDYYSPPVEAISEQEWEKVRTASLNQHYYREGETDMSHIAAPGTVTDVSDYVQNYYSLLVEAIQDYYSPPEEAISQDYYSSLVEAISNVEAISKQEWEKVRTASLNQHYYREGETDMSHIAAPGTVTEGYKTND